jgi:hypothetical protein
MKQVGRNLIDEVDGFLRDKRYLILDRDPVFTDAFVSSVSSPGGWPLGD